jgi:hypothetical protein
MELARREEDGSQRGREHSYRGREERKRRHSHSPGDPRRRERRGG